MYILVRKHKVQCRPSRMAVTGCGVCRPPSIFPKLLQGLSLNGQLLVSLKGFLFHLHLILISNLFILFF